jgi:hypothetical protein
MTWLIFATAFAADSVTLSFGLQDGDTALQTLTSSNTGIADSTVAGTSKMTIRREETGLSLSYTDGSYRVTEGDQTLNDLLEAVAGADATLHLSPSGAATGTTVPDSHQATMTKHVDQAMERLSVKAPGSSVAMFVSVRETFDPMTTPAFVARDLEGRWNNQVAFWIGAALVEGETYTTTTQGVSPYDDEPIELQLSFSLVGREPCGPHGGDCVRLKMISTPDKEAGNTAARRALDTLFAQAPISDELRQKLVGEATVELTTTVDILTEPDTLRPWQVVQSTASRLVIPMPGMPLAPEQKRVDTFSYVWGLAQ